MHQSTMLACASYHVKADSLMSLKNALAYLAVRDVEEGTRWYKMLLGQSLTLNP